MMLFYMITVGGLLASLQYRCQRKYAEAQRPTFAELERKFEIENRMLDLEIAALLDEHKALSSGFKIPPELRVSDELEHRFWLLEEELENGEG